ncbi:MAG: ammonium transporter, partial [Bacteroidia bacterium]
MLTDYTYAINTVWVALCAALIFLMEAGFALLEAGFIRSKNAMSIITKV